MRLVVLVSLVAVTLCSGALAEAASVSKGGIPDGVYGPSEAWVQAHSSASVDVSVIANGTRLRGIQSGVSCDDGPGSPPGLNPNTMVTVHIPGTIPISASGSFSYKGSVTLSTEDDQSPSPAKSTLAISGRFAPRPYAVNKTIAVTGTVSASICAKPMTTKFKLRFAEPA